MIKRIPSNYYTVQKQRFGPGKYYRIITDSPTLLSHGRYPTKLLPQDLPPSYVEGNYYGYLKGYLNTAGITDMVYLPSKFSNHLFKDDFLFFSYGGRIVKQVDKHGWCESDQYVWGWNIISILKGAEKYSGYDISPIKKQIEQKLIWLNENFPDEFARPVSIEEIFNRF